MLLCPDISKRGQLKVRGDPSSMISQSVVFQIDQCNPEKAALKGKKCKPHNVTTDYIKDVQLDTWVAYRKMNFLDKTSDPTFMVNDIFSSEMLNNKPDHIINRNYMYLRKNNLQLEDDYLQFEYTGTGTYFDVGKQFNRPLSKINKDDKDLLAKTKLFEMREGVL